MDLLESCTTWLDAHVLGWIGEDQAPRVLQERGADDDENFKVEIDEIDANRQRFVSQRRISRSELVEAARWTPSSDQSSPVASSPWWVRPSSP